MYPEEWKQIPMYPNFQFSTEGRVLNSKKNTILTPYNNSYWFGNSKNQKAYTITKLMNLVYPYLWIRELKTNEEYKQIKDFPKYFITTKGRIWNSKFRIWMKPKRSDTSYHYPVTINNDNKRYKTYIHTLVGRHFLEWKPGFQILHKDETLTFPEINYIENLWVGTQKDNVIDALDKKRHILWGRLP